jgi:hypothetical protein
MLSASAAYFALGSVQLVQHPTGLPFATPSCQYRYQWVTDGAAVASAGGVVDMRVVASNGAPAGANQFQCVDGTVSLAAVLPLFPTHPSHCPCACPLG